MHSMRTRGWMRIVVRGSRRRTCEVSDEISLTALVWCHRQSQHWRSQHGQVREGGVEAYQPEIWLVLKSSPIARCS